MELNVESQQKRESCIRSRTSRLHGTFIGTGIVFSGCRRNENDPRVQTISKDAFHPFLSQGEEEDLTTRNIRCNANLSIETKLNSLQNHYFNPIMETSYSELNKNLSSDVCDLKNRVEMTKEFLKPGTSPDSDFEAEDLNESPRLNQAELSDLVRDLDLSKQKIELLASRLQQWNLLLPDVKITEYRTREKDLHFFEKKEQVMSKGLMHFVR
ncbi:hypothetical protein TNIN_301991 [Trichonephila inaurata madagascariensis]|uniref:Uncharacterized protein n=1 Tax=Trichonephila inaurata madagascariensis TaxID=2747483 RepID=A0A8X6YAB0_9ARAC|nr:hypothetical protein TNIN_301991 [Trichonephila inaurata madagascariensis]